MTWIGLHRGVAGYGTGLRVGQGAARNPTNGRQGKRLALRAAQVVGWIEEFEHSTTLPCWRSRNFRPGFQYPERRLCPFLPALRP